MYFVRMFVNTMKIGFTTYLYKFIINIPLGNYQVDKVHLEML